MCTVIAKERQNTIIVLTGIPCCLAVEDVTPSMPKVTRANGWFELYVGAVCVKIPKWAAWLEGEAKEKATAKIPVTFRGKRVWEQDVSDRFRAVGSQNERRR